MKTGGISLGNNAVIDPSSSINYLVTGDNFRVAKRCTIFGSELYPLVIGNDVYVGMNSLLNGYAAQLRIGNNVSIAQNVAIMVDSGPNMSERLQRLYPIEAKPVTIGSHVWLGTNSVIMPGVELNDYTIVAVNSFVNKSFEPYSIIGGNPGKVIRKFTEDEIKILNGY